MIHHRPKASLILTTIELVLIVRGGGNIHSYEYIISRQNLLESWNEFLSGKRYKKDVSDFSLNLDKNLRDLHYQLKNKTYCHSVYNAFRINDPKPRDIHKSTVRDRIVHHALYKVSYPYFDSKFIHDSYSCRIGKGTHRAIKRFAEFSRKCSKNHTRTCWVLKCDIRKFFASIDHAILKQILRKHINDVNTMELLEHIVNSFCTPAVIPDLIRDPELKDNILDSGSGAGMTTTKLQTSYNKKGLPLGNLTSQLLVNIYMNVFDQCVKHQLKQKYYIRYADDFVFLSDNKQELEELLPSVRKLLWEQLRLELHPNKVFIKTFASGVDFLGWVHFTDHRILRTATKRRMIRNLKDSQKSESITSYKGMLSHGNAWKLQKKYLFSDSGNNTLISTDNSG